MFGQFGAKPAGSTFGTFGTANQQQQQQQQPQQPSLFGGFGASANTNQQQQQGQPQNPTVSAPGTLFGSTSTSTAQPATNPLFGGANTNTTQPGAGGSLFGSATTQQPNAGTTTLFGGGAQTGGTLFGSTQTNTSTAPATSLFGGSTAQAAGGAPGSLFGGSTNTSGTTGLFGQSTAATNPAPALFSGFAQTQNNAQSQQQNQPPSLFGQTQQQPQQTQQQLQQPSSLFGPFGQSTANAGSSLFGSAIGGGQAGASTIGSTMGASTLGASALGVPSESKLFASRSTVAGGQTQQQGDNPQAQLSALLQRINGIVQGWDATSPQCRFQYFFYNLVEPSQVHMYGRPQNAANDAAWQKTVRENPDPSCYVPALAVGFDDLQKRVEAQRGQSAAHQAKIKELKTRIMALSDTHTLTHAPRLQRAADAQAQLAQRLVRLVAHLHLLLPAVRSSAIRPEEEAIRSALESLAEDVRRPGGAGLQGRVRELWALVGAQAAARERDGRGARTAEAGWAVVDPEGLARITQILTEQQNGMAHLTKIVQGHLRDLDVILGHSPREEEGDAFSSSQANQLLLGTSSRGL